MAVLSRPINMSFEIAPNKTAAFLNRDNKNALQRAIARSDKHISKAEKEHKNADSIKR